MNRRLIPSVLIASLIAAAAFAASAQTVATSAGVDATTQAPAASDTRPDARVDPNAKPEIDPYCLRETGSRIPARTKDGKPCVAIGRTYDRDDINRTGEIDLADALRKLDPAIR